MTTLQILTWFGAQLCFIAFILMAAWHHGAAVRAFREHVPTPNTYEDPFHFWGAGMAIAAAMFLSAAMLPAHSLFWSFVFAKLCGCLYWLIFDPVLNKQVPGRSWDYIRSTKGLDGWLTDRFGDSAGEVKAAAMLVSIVSINVIRFL